MSGFLAQVGAAAETSYNTRVTPSRFWEFNEEGIQAEHARVESAGIRAGGRVLRSDRFVPVTKGAAGNLSLEVHNKGFGFWLQHMVGAVATTGAADPYTHTGTVADLTGDSVTLQVGRPQADGTVQPFTYGGGKVAEWSLENEVDGVLVASLGLDFASEDTGTALTTASYPTDSEVLVWSGGSVTIGGTSVAVTQASVQGNNNLKTDRHFLRSNAAKKEPLENGAREITYSLALEFEDMAQYDRVRSSSAAGAVAALVLDWTDSAGTHGLQVSIPAARLDGETPNVGGPEVLTYTVTGKALDNGTDSPVSLVYTTADATP